MADIAWERFARVVKQRLDARGLSYAGAVAEWPSLNTAMLSRAACGRPLSAGNFVLLCQLLRMRPIDFLIREKRPRRTLAGIVKALRDHSVTEVVPRET